MWYAIVFDEHGVQMAKSPDFKFSQQATFWAEGVVHGVQGRRYQLFQK